MTIASKTRTTDGRANSSRSQAVLKLNLVEVFEFNLLRSIPCERLHQHEAKLESGEEGRFLENLFEVALRVEMRVERVKATKKRGKTKIARGKATQRHQMFIIVSGSLTKKSLFEGAHKCRKRKTLNHSAYLSSLFSGEKVIWRVTMTKKEARESSKVFETMSCFSCVGCRLASSQKNCPTSFSTRSDTREEEPL